MGHFRLLRSAIFWLAVVPTSVAGQESFSSLPTVTNEPARLGELKDIGSQAARNTDDESDPDDLKAQLSRNNVVRQAAYSYGAQEGLYWRYGQILEIFERDATSMDVWFDFSKFLIDGKMLMPVVAVTEQIYEQQSERASRTVGVSYHLKKPARLVPTAPNWRDYITPYVDEPVMPSRVLLPQNDQEAEVWEDAVSEGWAAGLEQADDIAKYEIRRLTSVIEGMYLFRMLVAQGIVSMPVVQSNRYDILRMEDGQKMHVDDVITTISEDAFFRPGESWNPVTTGAESR
ncbi:hypothetical protein A3709_19570 [Halioglobus sp. HI00S01]|uniref:type IV secretory system conjugative DNA transfer family protein n=1 Tax=Halioglobus sp. HI00S01 TaxID=1822214 RepID=UPI0007C2E3D6|nr:type IV secretory system conjugative DNA transfer family protein [Halioglobus sp. HI00S01]KZX57825.1 hypothetical protein A3709_19570 [Halioglobus sp. HI00S01]